MDGGYKKGDASVLMEAVTCQPQLGEMASPHYGAVGDHGLMEAIREGDELAFSELVRRYRLPIINYVNRMLNDYDMAVDLAQETFIRIFTHAHRYRNHHKFSTYIYRIATNLAISELRRRKRSKLFSVVAYFGVQNGSTGGGDLELPDKRALPDTDLINDERREMVRRAVASLPEKYRTALILRDMEGLEYERIAEVLRLPLGTVKSRINRARGFLREKLRSHL